MTTLIQKGSYGSIFYPSIDVCNGNIDNDPDSKDYITKIQKLEDANSEIEIGNIIKTIPYYTHFFSPIESSCTINTKSISYELIKKCKIMQNELSEFEKDNIYSSSKIRYVGKHTLDEYIKGYPTKEAMGKLTYTIIEATQLSKTSIYVIGKWSLAKEKPSGGHFTLLWKKINNNWVIVSDHTS